MTSENPYKVFHSSCELLRKQLHVILVRPEEGGNVGSAARAMENMGILGRLVIVGNHRVIDENAKKFAKHAAQTLQRALFADTLEGAFETLSQTSLLKLAATARIGSAERPHPLRVRPAIQRAMDKLKQKEVSALAFVFGPEGSGLKNEEVALCDWVVTIPSQARYRSINLAQSVMIFAHETNTVLLDQWATLESVRPSQRQRVTNHILMIAEEAGFILPGDPFKMRPRLESIFERLPKHIPEAKTLHGLLDQVRRSLQKGAPDLKGRYLRKVEKDLRI